MTGLTALGIFLFVVVENVYGSFCGENALPYSLEILPSGNLVLGCAKPNCLGWANGRGAPSRFHNIDGEVDGFVRELKNFHAVTNETAECEETFSSTQCVNDGEWIGGIKPNKNNSETLLFRCCRHPDIKFAKFFTAYDLIENERYEGGEIYNTDTNEQMFFDYINNIVKFITDRGTVTYEVFVNRLPCVPLKNSMKIIESNITVLSYSKKSKIDTTKIYQAPTFIAANERLPVVDGNVLTQNANPTCSNAQIITNSGRGTDLPITQTQIGTSSITVTCTSGNPNTPLAMNFFQQNFQQSDYRGVTNGFGTVSQTLDCNPDGQLTLPPMPNLPNPVIVDQVECISPNPPPPQPPIQQPQAPAQFIPQQQPAFNPVASGIPQLPYYPVQFPTIGFGSFPSLGFLCFSGDTLVTTLNGLKKRLDELEINDWVLSSGGDVTIGYSKINSWIHRKPKVKAEFIKFVLEDGKQLKITNKHFIYRGDCSTSNSSVSVTEALTDMVYAEDVQPTDCLFVNHGLELIETKITKIEKVTETGIYAPMTDTGNIVVNDILASCYNIDKSPRMQSTLSTLINENSYWWSLLNDFLYNSVANDNNEIDLIPGLNTIISIVKYIIPQNSVYY